MRDFNPLVRLIVRLLMCLAPAMASTAALLFALRAAVEQAHAHFSFKCSASSGMHPFSGRLNFAIRLSAHLRHSPLRPVPAHVLPPLHSRHNDKEGKPKRAVRSEGGACSTLPYATDLSRRSPQPIDDEAAARTWRGCCVNFLAKWRDRDVAVSFF